MIAHYLKVALRNLLKYKTHSFISVLCLAIGITCFSLMNSFINGIDSAEELPNYERRIHVMLSTANSAADTYFSLYDIQYLEEQSIAGIDSLVTSSFPDKMEITAIDDNQQEFPFIVKYQCVSPNFFAYTNLKLIYGNRLPKGPDEVVVSQEFAQKVYGKKEPVGLIIHIDDGLRSESPIKDFKIVNVAMDNKPLTENKTDLFFGLSLVSSNSWLSVGSYLTGETTVEALNKQLEQVTWKRDEKTIRAWVYSVAGRNDDIQATIGKLLARFVASLILLSGLINFLKFIIQMFYNRQRELAIRKCVGSDIKGLFILLFSEAFWMMSAAFLLSLALTEISMTLAYIYIPAEDMPAFSMAKIYGAQFIIYIELLLVCLLTTIYPIYKLRQTSIIRQVIQGKSHHLFRNVMIGIQLAISIFFVGSVWVMTLFFSETLGKLYSPLSAEEEKQVISLAVNSSRMRQNLDAILSDVNSLPAIIDQTFMSYRMDIGTFTYMVYEKNDRSTGQVTMMQGDPDYFDFFRIPLEGKIVEKNTANMVYISKEFEEQLLKDSIQGTVKLHGADYQIAGVYPALYKEGGQRHTSGSVFLVNPHPSTYFFKVSSPEQTEETIKKIAEICRRYVPPTLPLDIRDVSDSKQTLMGAVVLMRNAAMLLAVISLLLVMLSIYSAISMDTINRQKEVAVRKINGATPKIIAILFGKVYAILFLIDFLIVYPLLRVILIKTSQGNVDFIYHWGWGVQLFIAMAFLIFLITAYKIYEIMHINPATILKKE